MDVVEDYFGFEVFGMCLYVCYQVWIYQVMCVVWLVVYFCGGYQLVILLQVGDDYWFEVGVGSVDGGCLVGGVGVEDDEFLVVGGCGIVYVDLC